LQKKSGFLSIGIRNSTLFIAKLVIAKDFPYLCMAFKNNPAMLLIYVTLGYILSIGFRAKPLISNRTIFDAKKPS
jgi:hypothetical protein